MVGLPLFRVFLAIQSATFLYYLFKRRISLIIFFNIVLLSISIVSFFVTTHNDCPSSNEPLIRMGHMDFIWAWSFSLIFFLFLYDVKISDMDFCTVMSGKGILTSHISEKTKVSLALPHELNLAYLSNSARLKNSMRYSGNRLLSSVPNTIEIDDTNTALFVSL